MEDNQISIQTVPLDPLSSVYVSYLTRLLEADNVRIDADLNFYGTVLTLWCRPDSILVFGLRLLLVSVSSCTPRFSQLEI